jgi:HPt (histidine-containing phosphotransfer) domain-containing protein
MQEDKDAYLASGMNDYIPKPVKLCVLANTLKQWLSEAQTTHRRSAQNTMAYDTSFDDAPVFDDQEFVARLMHDQEMANMVIENFLSALPNQIAELNKHLTMQHLKEATMEAHTIKGCAATISGQRLGKLAAAIEQAGRNGDLETMQQLSDQLHGEYDRLACLLNDFKES